jgi:2-iminobutanoate/2-iminopropanoate deaminase
MREVISTTEAPASIGPFSQAIRAVGLVFVSGQVAMDPETGQLIDGDIAGQTDRTLKNLASVLAAAGSGLDKVVRCSVFLRDMGDFAKMNEVYGHYFPAAAPARTTVEVSRLPRDARVEIDAIALA